MQPIKLDMQNVLKAARKAFDAGKLQAQQQWTGEACKYAGPCAIGAALTKPQQEYLDNDSSDCSISAHLRSGAVIIDAEAWDDLQTLQRDHDNWTTASFNPTRGRNAVRFGELLIELEAKYGKAA